MYTLRTFKDNKEEVTQIYLGDSYSVRRETGKVTNDKQELMLEPGSAPIYTHSPEYLEEYKERMRDKPFVDYVCMVYGSHDNNARAGYPILKTENAYIMTHLGTTFETLNKPSSTPPLKEEE